MNVIRIIADLLLGVMATFGAVVIWNDLPDTLWVQFVVGISLFYIIGNLWYETFTKKLSKWQK